MVGDEVWEEWTGSAVEGTDWWKGAKDEWAAKERAVITEDSTQRCGQGPSI